MKKRHQCRIVPGRPENGVAPWSVVGLGPPSLLRRLLEEQRNQPVLSLSRVAQQSGMTPDFGVMALQSSLETGCVSVLLYRRGVCRGIRHYSENERQLS